MNQLPMVLALLWTLPRLFQERPPTGLAGAELIATIVADSQSYFVYTYELVNPDSSRWSIGNVRIDVGASSGTPASLPATGTYRDLTGSTSGLPVEPHAEIGPITPDGWTATLNREARLAWFPRTSALSTADSVPPATAKAGFGLRSSYLPGLATFTAEPTVESCCVVPDTTDNGIFYPNRYEFSVTRATIVPRYRATEVDLALVSAQLQSVCSEQNWIDDRALCGELASLIDLARSSEAAGNVQAASSTLVDITNIIERNRPPDGPIASNAFWMLSLNVAQASRNLVP